MEEYIIPLSFQYGKEKQIRYFFECIKSFEKKFDIDIKIEFEFHDHQKMKSISGYGIAINLNKFKGKDWTKEFLKIYADFTLNNAKIFLDNVRERPDRTFIQLKNYEEFTSFIMEFGLPDFITFDHALGTEKSGYDCAKFLVDYCRNYKLELPAYKIHSQNLVEKEDIKKLFKNFEKSYQQL